MCAKPIECLTTLGSSISFYIQINVADGIREAAIFVT